MLNHHGWILETNLHESYYTVIRKQEVYRYMEDMNELTNKLNNGGVYVSGKIYKQSELLKQEVDLPNGIYVYSRANEIFDEYWHERLSTFKLKEDEEYVETSATKTVNKDIENFLNGKDKYINLKLFWKWSALFYGRPGNGKTKNIHAFLKSSLLSEAVIIFIKNKLPGAEFLENIKFTLKDRLKVFVFEELHQTIGGAYGENIGELLDFLDGETSLNNCIILATTNYPEKLPHNIVNRPSRFNKLYEFKNPNDADREVLLKQFLKEDFKQEYVQLTNDLSIDQIKEVVIQSKIREIDFEQANKDIQKQKEVAKNNFSKESKVGF